MWAALQYYQSFMSNIFISHNSKDNDFAQKVINYLDSIGHKSLYLDFDPRHGNPAGCNWEKELSRLLIKSDDFKVEVAHEALLRTWERLAKWLEEDRNFFICRKRLGNSLKSGIQQIKMMQNY